MKPGNIVVLVLPGCEFEQDPPAPREETCEELAHAMCGFCCGGQRSDARECSHRHCPMWPHGPAARAQRDRDRPCSGCNGHAHGCRGEGR